MAAALTAHTTSTAHLAIGTKLPVARDGITVRPWERRDRSTIAHWPAPEILAAWAATKTAYGNRQSYAIDLRGNLIGRISLRDILPGIEARLGVYLHPDYVSQGYGTTALAIFLDVFFSEFLWMRLDVAAANRRAIRCYEKLNFRVVHCEWRETTSGGTTVFQEMKLNREAWHASR